VTDGAIEKGSVDAQIPTQRHAYRQIAIVFVDEAQRLITLAGQMLRADLRQGFEDP
jgi:hypothetical protein